MNPSPAVTRRTRTLKKTPMDIRLAVAVRTLQPHLPKGTPAGVAWLAEKVLRPGNPYDKSTLKSLKDWGFIATGGALLGSLGYLLHEGMLDAEKGARS